MSLINRMLNDLTARQSPGAEATRGVRLSETLDAAAPLSQRTTIILVLMLIAVGGLAWLFWPRSTTIPAPQLRLAPTLRPADAAPGGDAGMTASDALQNGSVASGLSSDPNASAPRLQMASSLSLPARFSNPAHSTLRADQQPRSNVPLPQPATARQPDQARTDPEPKAMEPAVDAVQEQVPETRTTETAERQRSPKPAKPAQESVAATPPPATSAARAWLAAGNALAALEALGAPSANESNESLALRAAALQRLQRHEEAAGLYGRLTQTEPGQVAHWVGLAISLEGHGKHDAARVAYRRALSSDRLAPSLRSFSSQRLAELSAP